MYHLGILLSIAALLAPCTEAIQCKQSALGQEYRGTVSVTRTGRRCQFWSVQFPQNHTFTHAGFFPDSTMREVANYCRNPDREPEGPWCLTTDRNVGWEYCNIPFCRQCKTTNEGREYQGNVAVTVTGRRCMAWISQSPHSHQFTNPRAFPDDRIVEASNYCRNPDNNPRGPWCYTTDRNVRFEFCNVPRCPTTVTRRECIQTQNGQFYQGTRSTTNTGRTCQSWRSQFPHQNIYNMAVFFPDRTMTEVSNYCRNPSNDVRGPWCYTTDRNVVRDFCDIPLCSQSNSRNCKRTQMGREYQGTVAVTRTGRMCQRWVLQRPHVHRFTSPSFFPDSGFEGVKNYCRNPDGEPEGPWCFTTDPNVRWEYCSVPLCQRPTTRPRLTCKRTQLGKEYNGTKSTTRSGRQCQSWSSQTPRSHPFITARSFPDSSMADVSNYCRNPDNEPQGPWCYTTDPSVQWEYCDVPLCSVRQNGCSSTSDIILVLDSSGSLENQPSRTFNWAFIQEFTEMVILNIADSVERQNPGAARGLRFALVQFNDQGLLSFGLNEHSDYREAARVTKLARNLGGRTNMASGLQEAKKLLPQRRSGNVRKAIVIVISDWSPSNNQLRSNSINMARSLEREHDVNIVTVGVLGSSDRGFMQQVATGRRFVMSENHQSLLTHVAPLINVACERSQPLRSCERDVVFVMDASLSLSGVQDFNRLKTFVSQVAGNVYQTVRDTRLAVVVFSSNATVTIPLQLYTQTFVNQIQAIRYNPSLTNHADALRKARELLMGSTRSKYVIIFTDGLTTREQGAEAAVAEQMRRDGIQIIAFGVGRQIDGATLEKLVGSDKAGSHIFWSPDYQTNLMSKLNTLTFAAESCPARELPCVVRPPEVVLAIDASGSIKDKGANNWRLMQDFAVAVVQSIGRAYPQSRVAALAFSDDATNLITLTDNTGRVVNAIRSARHMNSHTNHAAAFRLAEQMLASSRQNSHKYIIMVTDGHATREIGREIPLAQELERKGIKRIMIGVTNDIDRDKLQRIGSSPPQRYVLYTENFDTLNAMSFISSVVTAAGQCQQPARQCFAADVILVMDSSGSIEEKGAGNFNLLKRFTANLAQNIARRYSGARFGLVLFSNQARVVASLNSYRSIQEFVRVVQGQHFSGSQTNIAAAIRVARDDARRYGRNNPQIILMTDGEPTAEMGQTFIEARNTRQQNVRISAVGITSSVDNVTLRQITGNAGRVFVAPRFQDLQNEVVQVAQVACQPEAPQCSGDVEVVFSLDASGSIIQLSQNAWQDARNLIKSAINAFYRVNQRTRFGLVVFSNQGRREFRLSNDVNRLPSMIDNVRYDQGRTNIADGIQIARTQVFNEARPGANKILILITDGTPNERVQETEPQADIAKREGITIVSVGITQNGPDYRLLSRIASSPQQVIRSLSFGDLNSRIGTLIRTSCSNFPAPGPTVNRFPNQLPQAQFPNQFPQAQFPNQFPQAQFPNQFPQQGPRFVFSTGQSCNGGYVIFVIDITSRLHYKILPWDGIPALGQMASNIVDTLSRRYRDMKFAVVTYETRATITRDFNSYRRASDLKAYLQQLTRAPVYMTNMTDGLVKAKEVIQRARASNAQVILLTDGITMVSSNSLAAIANEIRNSKGASITAIAVSRNYNETNLKAVTSPDYFKAENLTFDPNLLLRLVDPCITTQLGVVPLGDDSQGQSVIRKDCKDEIVFVVESSNSMNGNDWDDVRGFLVKLVDRLASTVPELRFGSTLFGNMSQMGFRLSNDIPDIKKRLKNLLHLGGSANIAAGLRSARQWIFTDNSAKKMVVLLIDGDPALEVNATFQEADMLRRVGIEVLVVGISDMLSRPALERLAGDTKNIIHIVNFKRLQDKLADVANFACKQDDRVIRPAVPQVNVPPLNPDQQDQK